MRLIVAGSRGLLVDSDFIHCNVIMINYYLPKVTEIVSGTAAGIDKSGEFYAEDRNLQLTKFPADWDKHGKGAGHIRNKQMAEYADALLLIWDGESRGSANMKETMLKLKKPVYEVILRKHNI